MDELEALYKNFCSEFGYPDLAADELLYTMREEGNYNQEHMEWVQLLLELWEATQNFDI